jgi:hypothetical protein
MEKENKKVQAYSLPPHQIAWLRQRAAQQTTDNESVSASAVLERIIEAEIEREANKSPLPHSQPASKKSHTAQAVAA